MARDGAELVARLYRDCGLSTAGQEHSGMTVVVVSIPLGMLRDNDVVEVTRNLLTAFLTVGSVSYTEGLLHARLIRGPRIDSVFASAVSVLSPWGRGSRCRRRRTTIGIGHAGVAVHVLLRGVDVRVENHSSDGND